MEDTETVFYQPTFNTQSIRPQNDDESDTATFYKIIIIINVVFLCEVISLIGTVGNVINMIIFYKQGLNTTINISFFAVSLSDLCSLMFQLVFCIYMVPLFEDLDLPMVYRDVQYLTGGVPRESFAGLTCMITTYIAAERCLCITFPLHVKQMITPKRTTTIMCLFYLLMFVLASPIYFTTYIGWKMQHTNRTLLSIVVTGDYEAAQAAVYLIHGIYCSLSFLAVVILTAILIRKLREKSVWRETMSVPHEKSESISQRDKKTMRMVVLIAIILIICYTPAVLLTVVTFFEPEFSVGARYNNLYFILWSFGFVFVTINSSVNILLYLKMSTKYKQSFQELFNRCAKHKQ